MVLTTDWIQQRQKWRHLRARRRQQRARRRQGSRGLPRELGESGEGAASESKRLRGGRVSWKTPSLARIPWTQFRDPLPLQRTRLSKNHRLPQFLRHPKDCITAEPWPQKLEISVPLLIAYLYRWVNERDSRGHRFVKQQSFIRTKGPKHDNLG